MEVYKAIGVALLTLAIALGMGTKKAMDFTGLVCRAAWKTPTARKARRALRERLNGWKRNLSQRVETEWTALMFLVVTSQMQIKTLEIGNEV